MPGRMVLNALPFCRFCHITFIRKHHLFDRAFSQRFPNMVSFLIIRALTPYINISSHYVFFLAQISDDWSDAWINLAVTFRSLELTHKTHQCGANLQIFSNQKITKKHSQSKTSICIQDMVWLRMSVRENPFSVLWWIFPSARFLVDTGINNQHQKVRGRS